MRVISLAPNHWQGQWVNRQQLMSRLGRRHRVVYSTGAWSVWERHSSWWQHSPTPGRVEQMDGVHVELPPKYLLRWQRWPAYDDLVVRLHARRLRRILGAGTDPLAVVLFHPSFVPYVRHLAPDVLAYHAYDLFEATPEWDAQMQANEDALIRQADLVTTVSHGIIDRFRERGHGGVNLLPNGVDLEAFAPSGGSTPGMPADLAAIPAPRLGYVGSLHPQVDYGLVAELASARRDWNFVFVGGLAGVNDKRMKDDLKRIERLPNVHFLGERDRSAVPSYVANMDVNLMLYRVSTEAWVKAGYPLKLHEYLAVGRPVVSTPIMVAQEFDQVVRIAEGVDDWIRAIAQALDRGGTGTPAARHAVAAANTWDARVAQMETWLQEAIASPRRRSPSGPRASVGRASP